MKMFHRIQVLGLTVIFGLLTSGSAWASLDDVDAGTAPGYVKRSATEEKAIQSSSAGVNVQGESGGFDDYLNDDLFPEDEEIRLMDVDSNSRVVLGADDAPAGVSFKKSYEKSPIVE